MLRDVFAECKRVLEPGGRIAVNVANLGRKPYRSLSADVIRILQDDLGLLLRGEILWVKADGAAGSVAWGSFRKATNPVLRDLTERVIVASKGRFDRARSPQQREQEGYPYKNTMSVDEFMEATLDVWRIDAESARRVQHPAPFPLQLPRRLIELYTYENDLVLDPFVGSGTSLVAAARSGRRAVGYDLESGYVETARQRYIGRGDPGSSSPSRGSVDRSAAARVAGVARRTRRTLPGASHLGREEGPGSGPQSAGGSGFRIIKEPYKIPKVGVQFNFHVIDANDDREYLVDVSGAFTTVRPGPHADGHALEDARPSPRAEGAGSGGPPPHPHLEPSTTCQPGRPRACGPWDHGVSSMRSRCSTRAARNASGATPKDPDEAMPGFWSRG